MNKTKLDYSAPQAEAFVVRFERRVCQSVMVDGATRGNGYGNKSIIYLEDDED